MSIQIISLIEFLIKQKLKLFLLFKGGPKINLSVAKLLPVLEKMLKLKYKLLNVHRLDADTTGVMLFATLVNLFNYYFIAFITKQILHLK